MVLDNLRGIRMKKEDEEELYEDEDELLDNDEISAEEEGFIKGYKEAS